VKYINEEYINQLLSAGAHTTPAEIDMILAKSKALKRLSLEDTAKLLTVEDPDIIKKILATASYVKNTIYGKRVVLFAPLYINNFCVNNCLYCSFKADNKKIKRKALSTDEIRQQTEWLLKRGHK
jgi:2-iminoacetate synthase